MSAAPVPWLHGESSDAQSTMSSTSPLVSRSIAIVRQSYNPFGGAERFVARALAALADQGLAITLVTRKWDSACHPDQRVLFRKPFYIGRLWRDASFARAARETIAAENFDLVQSHERIPGCDIFRAGDGVHATWMEQRARTLGPFMRLAQKISPWHRYTVAAETAMFRHPGLRAVICNSDMVRSDIARRFPAIASKLHVIHNGVDMTRFNLGLRQEHRIAIRQQMGVSERTPVVVHVGSGFARKGVPQLIDAFRNPRLKDVELWLIGEDKHAARLAARASNLGPRIRFLGGQQDVAPYLAAADLFALPTLYDPMPNAALEALACGLPVLTSRSSGAAELITSSSYGAVVDALDVAAIAQEIARLLMGACDPRQVEAMRNAAFAAVAHLSSVDMAARQIALYRGLLTEADKSRPL
ncbi:MAG TPA: glycosyltransferase family 4 protein [Rhodocyclaceae bacterium]|nr:glycosyltransferase family 4 protein [Rhodocyclaceae bacterium]